MGRLAGAASKLGDVVFYLWYVPLAIILCLATCVGRAILWFQRHVYWRNAPFRIVRGPYLLVLRSFSNRMATTKRVTRVILMADGQEVTVPEFVKAMPDLTVIRFLTDAAQHARQPLVGVSNGTSLDGALRLVHSHQERWFDAVRILATHARAILAIPDNSPALLREIAHSWRFHPSKLAILMPPSNDRTERVRDLMKLYRVEGVDLSSVWADTKEEGPAMDHVGIDVHKGASQICVFAAGGELIERRVRTEPARLAEALEDRVPARVLIEASTESEWVARCLEQLGHQVIVADPNCAPMYATRQRKVKTDRRDARAVAEACVLGAYRRAHRLSDAQRHVRGRLGVRDALVRTRTRYMARGKACDRCRCPLGRSNRGDITDEQQWWVEINLVGEGATYRLGSSWQRRGLAGPGDRLTRVGGPP